MRLTATRFLFPLLNRMFNSLINTNLSTYFLGAHTATGDLKVVLAAIAEVVRACLKQRLHRFVRLEQNVHVAGCNERSNAFGLGY